MDHKTWLWRKKSSEKTIVAADKVDISLKHIDAEVQTHPAERGYDTPAKHLNEKLAAVLLDCHANNDLEMKQEKLLQEANAGREKAEAEAVFLKKELDEAVRHGVEANEKLTHSDAALKKCMQQLEFVREEQERKIRDAILKTSCELEKAQKALEEKLVETRRRVTELAIENAHLSKALLVKEELIDDQHKQKVQAEVEFSTLIARLDSVEKENAFLKYEFRILEKELEIRNEELEYSRQSVDAAHKQHLASVKKITKLESECQRLRLLLRKRLPGPAAMVKLKSEVEMLGRDQQVEMRKKTNSNRSLVVRDCTMENTPGIQTNNLSHLIEQLRNVEEENKILKQIATNKNAELQSSRLMYSRTSSRLSQVEAQLKGLSNGQNNLMEVAQCSTISSELTPRSGFDIVSDNGVTSSSSWANALISELEHFIDGNHRNPQESKAIIVPEMTLMDDFVEMEKLALVSVGQASGGRRHQVSGGEELVPVAQGKSGFSESREFSKDVATEKPFDWLQVVLNAISEQRRISKRSLDELVEDIKIALGYTSHQSARDISKMKNSVDSPKDPLVISGFLTWNSPNSSPLTSSLSGDSTVVSKAEATKKQEVQLNLSNSISKIIELVEGINLTSSNSLSSCFERDQSPRELAEDTDYFIHVFQWKSSELSTVLQQFVCTCNLFLNGEADLENFAREISHTLDWILNNCVTPKDASSTRNKIRRHFGWNKSQSGNDIVDGGCMESDIDPVSKSAHDQNDKSAIEGIQLLQEENKSLKDALKKMEARLESATDKSKALAEKLKETEETVGSLQAELKNLKHTEEISEDQIENQKSINEDLDTQLTIAKAKLNEVFQRCSSMEVELEYKNNCCEELEATCLELQLQLESVAKETPKIGGNLEEKQPQNGWEITAASVKLAECQETILNLGKQLKVLASPREAALFDRVFSTSGAATTMINNKRLNKHFSLRDQMLAEDGAKAEILRSPKVKGTLSIEDAEKQSLPVPDPSNCSALQCPIIPINTVETRVGSKKEIGNAAVMSLAIVPSKKKGVGLLRRLLMRRKKGMGKACR
ncbi:hypothetical protein SLE2022_204360 [Rubroshorea leprosula]